MTRLLTIGACLLAAAGLMAGCGSSKKSSTGGQASAPAASGGTSVGGGGGGVQVSMKNIKFNPATVNVKVGQEITWTNNDPVPHTVTATSGAHFDSGTVNAGGNYQFKPTAPGTIEYKCTIHPNQTGKIVVTR